MSARPNSNGKEVHLIIKRKESKIVEPKLKIQRAFYPTSARNQYPSTPEHNSLPVPYPLDPSP